METLEAIRKKLVDDLYKEWFLGLPKRNRFFVLFGALLCVAIISSLF